MYAAEMSNMTPPPHSLPPPRLDVSISAPSAPPLSGSPYPNTNSWLRLWWLHSLHPTRMGPCSQTWTNEIGATGLHYPNVLVMITI